MTLTTNNQTLLDLLSEEKTYNVDELSAIWEMSPRSSKRLLAMFKESNHMKSTITDPKTKKKLWVRLPETESKPLPNLLIDIVRNQLILLNTKSYTLLFDKEETNLLKEITNILKSHSDIRQSLIQDEEEEEEMGEEEAISMLRRVK